MTFKEWLHEIRYTSKAGFYHNLFEGGMSEEEIDREWALLKHEYLEYCNDYKLKGECVWTH